jgi:tetratricopeptide (TPR) repeat protein
LARLHFPSDARLLLRLSDTVQRRGQYAQSLEYLEMAAAIDPENPLYLQELGKVYDTLGALEQAKGARSRASRLEQAFQTYAEAVGLVSRGEDEEAAALLESVIHENPEFITGCVLLADLYRRAGKNERALSIYQSVLRRDPSRARVKEETAWLYVDKGEVEAALEILKETDPEDVNHALVEGYQKLIEADWEGAMTEFKKAEMRYPLNPRILQQISLCLNSMGRPDEALAYLEKAHAIQPENNEIDSTARLVRFEYGLNLEKEGRWSEALAIFRRLRDEDNESADYFFHEAYCRQHLWDYPQAIELYKQGLRLDPQAAWVRINLATCLYALSLYDEAAEQWELLVEASTNPEYAYNLGLARIRQWRLNEGWDLIAQAADAGFEPARQLQRARQR